MTGNDEANPSRQPRTARLAAGGRPLAARRRRRRPGARRARSRLDAAAFVFAAFWWAPRSSCCGNGSGSVRRDRVAERVAAARLALAVAAVFALHSSAVGAAAALGRRRGGGRLDRRSGGAGRGRRRRRLRRRPRRQPRPSAREPGYGLPRDLWLFAVVWGPDVAAYFGGRLIGGPKLWPSVSPGKTWSGRSRGRRRARVRPLPVGGGRPDRPAVLAGPCGRGRVGTGRSVRIGVQATVRRQGFEPPHSRPRRPDGQARRLHCGFRLRRAVRCRPFRGLASSQADCFNGEEA